MKWLQSYISLLERREQQWDDGDVQYNGSYEEYEDVMHTMELYTSET